MREVQLRESSSACIELERYQAMVLRRMGAELASSSLWWGAASAEGPERRSVIRVEQESDAQYRVTVMNMIGVIALDDLQIQIHPKIPRQHFLHLVQASELLARSCGSAELEPDWSFAQIVASWFTAGAEHLLRRGLRPEYVERVDDLDAVRGQMQLLQTALLVQQGRPLVSCRFEDLAHDSAMNRLVKAAASAVASSASFSESLRTRARSVKRRMEGVGEVRPSDMGASPDRLSGDYSRVIPLAKLLLQGLGVGLKCGDTKGRSFLLRTPELVEAGVRQVIAMALPGVRVEGGRLMLGATGLSLNPDLVFDRGRAVGDVKYKVLTSDWNRGDLYQAIAFATAYRSPEALVVGFHQGQTPRAPRLRIGDVSCQLIAWDARFEVPPEIAQEEFQRAVRGWHSKASRQELSAA